LLSELDVLLAEPMSAVLQRVPLRDRVLSAVGGHHGVYWPALDLALAIESGQALQVSRQSLQHRISLAQINSGILHLLTTLPSMVQVDNSQ
jgi:c-di-GMP-related signal transduction protein